MCCLICFNYVSFEKDVTNHFTPVLGSVFARDVVHDIGVKRKVILCGTSEAMFYAMETA